MVYNGETEILCIYGNPVGHSMSPLIQNRLLKATGINAVYVPFCPDKEHFEDAISAFRTLKMRGANVTIPFKCEFVNDDGTPRLVDELSDISRFSGSVNTLYWKDGIIGGTLCGTTTDSSGFLINLNSNGVPISGNKIAVLGNGGAAKAILYALAEAGNDITIVCRSLENGLKISDKLNSTLSGNSIVSAVTFDEFESISRQFNIIVNATPVGMQPDVRRSPISSKCLHNGQTVCDIIYTPEMTELIRMAWEKGCKVVTGSGMLFNQAHASFKIWFPNKWHSLNYTTMLDIMRGIC